MIAKLINVGRGKVCKEIKELKSLSEVLEEVRKHLMSSEVELVENKKESSVLHTVYDVIVGGFRMVGKVEVY